LVVESIQTVPFVWLIAKSIQTVRVDIDHQVDSDEVNWLVARSIQTMPFDLFDYKADSGVVF
jgi:hypothetical protein